MDQTMRARTRSARKARRRRMLYKYKFSLGCAFCPSSGPFEFHHIDPATKVEGIARMVSRDRSKAAIFAEVEKCEVLCRACHDMVHERSKHDYS